MKRITVVVSVLSVALMLQSGPVTNWVSVGSAVHRGDMERAGLHYDDRPVIVTGNPYIAKEEHVRRMVDANMTRRTGEHPRDFRKRKEAEVQRLLQEDFEAPAKMVEQSERIADTIEETPRRLPSSEASRERAPEIERVTKPSHLERVFLENQYAALGKSLDDLNSEAQTIMKELDLLEERKKLLTKQLDEISAKYEQTFEHYAGVCDSLKIKP